MREIDEINEKLDLLMEQMLMQIAEMWVERLNPYAELNYTAEQLMQDWKSVDGEVENFTQENQWKYKRRFKAQDYLLKGQIWAHFEFLFVLLEYIHKNPDSHENRRTFKTVNLFSLLLINLINLLVSIRRLLADGMTTPAKILLRSYIEYADISIAILYKYDFYCRFTAEFKTTEDVSRIWYGTARGKKVQKELKEFYEDVDPTGNVWAIISDLRNSLYQDLSFYAHVTNMTTILSALKNQSKSDNFGFNILGSISDSTKSTLSSVIFYPWLFLKYSMLAIVKYQNLPFQKFGEHGLRYMLIYKVTEEFANAFSSLWTRQENAGDDVGDPLAE